MSEMIIGVAGESEREASYRLLYQAFVEDMGIQHKDADHERRTIIDTEPTPPVWIQARLDGETVGTMAVRLGDPDGAPFDETFERDFEISRFTPAVRRERMAYFYRFAIRPDYRSTLVPFRLMTRAAEVAAVENGVELAFCSCQPHLINLYEGLGFRPYAPPYDLPRFGLMVPLVLVVSDFDHLRALRSPLLRTLPETLEDVDLAARVDALLPTGAPVGGVHADDVTEWAETFGLLSTTPRPTGPFDGLTADELATLVARCQTIECSDGQAIVVAGHDTRVAYVVLEGTAEARVQGSLVGRFERGEMFGELAMLLDVRRTADVVAVGERVRVLALDERTLQRLLASSSELAAKVLLNISKSLAQRLLAANA